MPISQAPSPLGALLKELFRSKKWQHRLDQHGLFLKWEEIVGADIARRARPDCIRGDVLWLRVIDSVWMQQLSLQKTTLLALLNGRLGEKGVKDIRFRLDITLNDRRPPSSPDKKPGRDRTASPEELREFGEMTLSIEDEELKEAMRRLWLKTRRHRG